jgi:hypothetical protein
VWSEEIILSASGNRNDDIRLGQTGVSLWELLSYKGQGCRISWGALMVYVPLLLAEDLRYGTTCGTEPLHVMAKPVYETDTYTKPEVRRADLPVFIIYIINVVVLPVVFRRVLGFKRFKLQLLMSLSDLYVLCHILEHKG